MTGAATAIEVEDVAKTFRIPTHRVETLKERIVRPFSAGEFRELRALREIGFDVGRGEFFGIVGRNGSGKSTLLKILAGIYSAERGEVRVDGRIAPFIELGVGFNPDLTARENIVLNGVMVGLSRREAERRLDAVVEFAELEDFVDLKLKNYSSGMLVRLAFSVMMQSDAEILLIDEVLAVGDAAFQQKCRDCFTEMRDAGRTIVLVTHDMGEVERFCDRALLLRGGGVDTLGDPDQVARRYLELNFADRDAGEAQLPAPEPGDPIGVVEAWLESGGARHESIEHGSDVELHLVLEAREDIPGPSFALTVVAPAGADVFGFGAGLEEDEADTLRAGDLVEVKGGFSNRLAPGRYSVRCWVTQNRNERDLVAYLPHAHDFVVFGVEHVSGLVALAGQAGAHVVRSASQSQAGAL